MTDLPVIRVPGNFTLLVVEDNAEMRTYIEDLLRPHFTLEFAGNGQSGLDVLKERKVDLILTDYMMPIMDGFEFIKAVKDHDKWKNSPTIFLTARAEDDDNPTVLGTAELTVVAKDSLSQEAEVTFSVAYVEIVLNTDAVLIELEVFPNPAKNEVQVINSETLGTIQLLDVAGRGYQIAPVKTDKGVSISLQHIPSGQYILWIELGDKRLF